MNETGTKQQRHPLFVTASGITILLAIIQLPLIYLTYLSVGAAFRHLFASGLGDSRMSHSETAVVLIATLLLSHVPFFIFRWWVRSVDRITYNAWKQEGAGTPCPTFLSIQMRTTLRVLTITTMVAFSILMALVLLSIFGTTGCSGEGCAYGGAILIFILFPLLYAIVGVTTISFAVSALRATSSEEPAVRSSPLRITTLSVGSVLLTFVALVAQALFWNSNDNYEAAVATGIVAAAVLLFPYDRVTASSNPWIPSNYPRAMRVIASCALLLPVLYFYCRPIHQSSIPTGCTYTSAAGTLRHDEYIYPGLVRELQNDAQYSHMEKYFGHEMRLNRKLQQWCDTSPAFAEYAACRDACGPVSLLAGYGSPGYACAKSCMQQLQAGAPY